MKAWNQDAALARLQKLRREMPVESLSEADTRAKAIDVLLTEVLGWIENDIRREERCVETETFLDYKLSTNIPQYIIEAKKSSFDFELPNASNSRVYKIGGVLKNSKGLQQTLVQARDYGVSKGIACCVVTNGDSYVFFRAYNQQGIDWVEHTVIVFRGLEDIESDFDRFCCLLSKQAVERGLLPSSLPVSRSTEEDVSRFRTLDATHLAKPRKKDRNPLFPYLGEIVYRVFQDLATEDSDSDILQHCYVDTPRKGLAEQPYLDIRAKPLTVSKKDAGDFQERVIAGLVAGRVNQPEVILLIGSVGVGKSTFIQRFRKVLAKEEIDKHGIWIYFNFKKFSDTGASLDAFINAEIEDVLEKEYSDLGLFDWHFLKQVYHSEYEKLKRGVLAPIFARSEQEFEEAFAKSIAGLMSEKSDYIKRTLSVASKKLKRSIFLVFDNADQLSTKTQNDIFLVAQRLTQTIGCYALLALREESYWKNRDSGPLNAFHTTAYHVQPAGIRQVISKRFHYVRKLLEGSELNPKSDFLTSNSEVLCVFERLVRTLLGEDESYIKFIESTAAGDIRRALDTVAAFMTSGHTNIEAILRDERRQNPDGFPVPFHEFLNAIMLRDHDSFSEEHSDVVNLFNVSGSSDAHNFNRIAVLGKVLNAKHMKTPLGTGYVLLDEVVVDCQAVGLLPDTTIAILTMLNARRLIESETTIKDSLDQSRYVRATVAGEYYIEHLTKLFDYLDIVVFDTPIGRDKSFKQLNRLSQELNQLVSRNPRVRLERLSKRLELCDEFIDYLTTEFNSCAFRSRKDKFSLSTTNLMQSIRTPFDATKLQILENAQKVLGREPA